MFALRRFARWLRRQATSGEIEGKLHYQGETPRYQTLFTMGDTYTVVTKNGWNEDILFQSVDGRSLIRDYHVDAVFLGPDNRTFYKVKWVNNRQRKVVVEPVRTDYHTRGIVRDSIEIHDITNPLISDAAIKSNLGNIIVKRSTFGYKNLQSRRNASRNRAINKHISCQFPNRGVLVDVGSPRKG